MNLLKNRVLILGLLLVISLFFRLIWISKIPYGLNWDENAYAYNAYSLFLTGKDELSGQFALYFRSFGDYKPALASYMLVPLFSIFGPSDLSVRLLPAILGTLGITCFYQFMRRITNNLAGLITAVVMTLSPLYMHFSRAVMDPIVGLSFLLFGLLLLTYKSLISQIGAALFLILSMYSYNSSRFFVPAIVTIYLLVISKNSLMLTIKKYWLFLSLLIFLGSIIIFQTLFGLAGSRMRFLLLSNEPYIAVETNKHYDSCVKADLPLCRIIANRRIILAREITKNYLLHFQPDFLFFNRNYPTTSYPEYGNLLLITLPFLIIGFFTMNRYNKKINIFFLVWLLLAPIPSAITNDVPHPGRFLNGLPALSYFISLGFITVINSVKELKNKKRLIYVILSVFIINFLFYIKDYALIYKQDSEYYFQGFFREVIPYVWNKRDDYSQIYFSKEYADPYIFFAWINKVNPYLIQKDKNRNSINNIHFVPSNQIAMLFNKKIPSSLFVSNKKLSAGHLVKEFKS